MIQWWKKKSLVVKAAWIYLALLIGGILGVVAWFIWPVLLIIAGIVLLFMSLLVIAEDES